MMTNMSNENIKYFCDSLINGDNKGILKIYQLVYPKVLKFVLKNSGQTEDAEDVFQKALIQFSARLKLKRVEFHSSFEAYLFTICMNLWRRELNLKKRRVTNIPNQEHYDEHSDSIQELLEQEKWELYTEMFNKLSENCKEVLGFYYNKVSYADIVKKLSYTTESVARQRVFKCRKKLSDLVKKDKRFKQLKAI
ncbi:RNA polymerase sigma factor [Pontimicrobium sp. MEBiC06410]